jgi:hypothetical protein
VKLLIKAAIRIVILIMGIKLLFALFKYGSLFFTDTGIFQDGDFFSYLGYIFCVDIAGLIVLCILWWKTDWLVKLLCGNIEDSALVINTSNIDFITVIIQIIGIYLVVTSIPDFVGLAVYHIQIRNRFPGFDISELQVQETKQWVITSITFVIGLLLASSSKWLVKRIRGTNNSE